MPRPKGTALRIRDILLSEGPLSVIDIYRRLKEIYGPRYQISYQSVCRMIKLLKDLGLIELVATIPIKGGPSVNPLFELHLYYVVRDKINHPAWNDPYGWKYREARKAARELQRLKRRMSKT